MQLNKNKEIIFFHYIKNRPEYFQDIDVDFFKEPSTQCLYKLVRRFHQQYKKNITDDNIEAMLKNDAAKEFHKEDEKDKSIYFDQKLFDTTMAEGHKAYDKEYIKDEFENYAKYYFTHAALEKVSNMLIGCEWSSENADKIRGNIRNIVIRGTTIDFDMDLGSNIRDAKSHQSVSKKRFTTGYNWMDECLEGGFCEGELVCIAGPAKGGKSLFMANLARNQVANGKNVYIITLEMQENLYMERVGRNLLSMGKKDYREQIEDEEIFQVTLDNFFSKNISKELGKVEKPGELYIKFMPASTATIPMIENYIDKLEHRLQKKIDLVILDYINLCCDWKNPNSDNTYNKIKSLSIDFRDLLSRKKYAGVTGTQLNREGATAEKIHEGHISESKALVDNLDALFGLKNRTTTDTKNHEISLTHMLSRNGEKKRTPYKFRIEFDCFRISEKDQQNLNVENNMLLDSIDEDVFNNNDASNDDNNKKSDNIIVQDNSVENVFNF